MRSFDENWLDIKEYIEDIYFRCMFWDTCERRMELKLKDMDRLCKLSLFQLMCPTRDITRVEGIIKGIGIDLDKNLKIKVSTGNET